MMRDSYHYRQQSPPVLESMEIVVALILMAVCWFAWYVARERYYLENTPNCRIGVLPDPNRARHHRSLYPYYY